jgi:hypothetical protein
VNSAVPNTDRLSSRLLHRIGNLKAIAVEVTGVFLVALYHERYRSSRALALLLGLVVLVLLSLRAYASRVRSKQHQLDLDRERQQSQLEIDHQAAELSTNVIDVLETALTDKKWKTVAEANLCQVEAHPDTKEVWVLTANLKPDLGCRKQVIQQNLRAGKTYHYLLPNEQLVPRFQVLFEQCAWRIGDRGFVATRLEARCLSRQSIPPVDVVICQPGDQVYFYFDRADKKHCVLSVPVQPLGNDIVSSVETLWKKLPEFNYAPDEPAYFRGAAA